MHATTKAMHTKLELIRSRIIYQKEDLDKTLARWKFREKKVVFTNGCFDILHRGHIEYLAKAAALGDFLVVGLNSDASVRRLKGPERPVTDEESRALALASLRFVERVVLFTEDTPYELIRYIKPQVLVKGGDYQPQQIVGYDIVKHNGGKVITIDFVEGFSTTALIEKLKK